MAQDQGMLNESAACQCPGEGATGTMRHGGEDKMVFEELAIEAQTQNGEVPRK